MRLLLDTHTFLWFVLGDSRCSQTARELIEDEANETGETGTGTISPVS